MSLQPATLSGAIRDVAEIKNWSPVNQRKKIVDLINDARYTLWRTDSFRRAHFGAEGCACVELFREKCLNCMCPNFPGITLPAGMVDVYSLRWNDLMIEWQPDCLLTNPCAYPIAAEKQTRYFERDYAGAQVIFRRDPDFPADEGKKIGVLYYDMTGAEHREDLCLSLNGVSTSTPVMQFEDVIFPEHQGVITVRRQCGRFLGRYNHSIIRPQHTHFKIPQMGCGRNQIFWKGYREVLPVRYDTDPIEYAGMAIWRAIFNWLELFPRSNLKGDEEKAFARLTATIEGWNNSQIKSEDSGMAGRIIPDGSGLLSGADFFSEGYYGDWRGGYGYGGI